MPLRPPAGHGAPQTRGEPATRVRQAPSCFGYRGAKHGGKGGWSTGLDHGVALARGTHATRAPRRHPPGTGRCNLRRAHLLKHRRRGPAGGLDLAPGREPVRRRYRRPACAQAAGAAPFRPRGSTSYGCPRVRWRCRSKPPNRFTWSAASGSRPQPGDAARPGAVRGCTGSSRRTPAARPSILTLAGSERHDVSPTLRQGRRPLHRGTARGLSGPMRSARPFPRVVRGGGVDPT